MPDQRVRGDAAGRPPTQWGASEKSPPSSGQVLARGVGALGALVNPVVAVVAVLWVVGGRALSRKARAWVSVAGGAAFVVAVLLRAGRGYTRPYRELADAARDGGQDAPGTLGDVAAEEWPGWIVSQLPVALTAGTLAGGLWLLWRYRYRPTWRESGQARPARQVQRRLTELTRGDDRPPAASVDELTLRLGVDIATAATVTVPGRALRQHAFIAGATGYGKSRSIEQLAYELIASPHAQPLRIPWLFADMKADPDLVAALHGAAHRAGRRFRLITVTGQGETYNPVRHGSAEQVRSRIVECLDQVAGGGFSEPHHREAAEEFLLYCVRALDDLVAQQVTAPFPDGVRAWRRDLPDLARLMTIKALSDRLPQLTEPVRADITVYLTYLQDEAKELMRSIPGLATRVRNLISGDAGRVLAERPGGIDLYSSIKAGDIVLFSLSAARDARAARQVGSLFLTDLGAVGDRLLEERWGTSGGFFLAGVDEFSGLGGSTMASLFQRIRGAGGSLILCTQDMADLTEVGPAFQNAVMTNTNVMILHRQKASAADIAELLGTRQAWQETIQLLEDVGPLGTATSGSGAGSLREVDKFKVHPNTLRELAQGQAVVTVGHPQDSINTVRMLLAPRFPVPDEAALEPAVEQLPAVALTKETPVHAGDARPGAEGGGADKEADDDPWGPPA